jgi:saccharopine dehydrogenase-like NADP-dependent oxidoreductase
MSTCVVLGGAGGVAQVAVAALLVFDTFDRIVVADLNESAAAAVVERLADSRLESAGFDASDAKSIAAVLEGADVALNCVGPFYRFGPPILQAAIEAGVDYVDICDDLAPTRTMLELDQAARDAGISALLGMGNSPGLANVFVKLVADSFLDEVHEVDIMHIHGGEPSEGAAVIKHRIHAMLNDVPLFIDGEFVKVRQLEESGAAHTVETDFRNVGRFPVYPYPHPETITLPAHIPGLRRATNLGVIFPLSYFHLTQAMVRAGTCGTQPIEVQGRPVVPIEFAVAHIQSERPRLLAEAGIEGPGGCLKVVVGGMRKGQPRTYVLQLSSSTAGAGEGTGIPAAAGAMLMGAGRIPRKGVFPPEAGVDPLGVLVAAFTAVAALGKGGADNILIEQIDADGTVTPVPLPF